MNTREFVVSRMMAEREKLLLAIAGLTPANAERLAIGERSVKDVVVHITARETNLAQTLELINSGRINDIEPITEEKVDEEYDPAEAEHRGQTWPATLEALSAARERLFTAIMALNQEQFSRSMGTLPLIQWLRQWTAEHDATHSFEILKWRDQQDI